MKLKFRLACKWVGKKNQKQKKLFEGKQTIGKQLDGTQNDSSLNRVLDEQESEEHKSEIKLMRMFSL